jgi:branched-chain amino acid transport system permease protein
MDRRKLATLVVFVVAAVTLPMWAGDQYQLHLATLIAAYWVLIGGLNLVIGYSGQLSIGHVGLLSIGAYAFAILAGKAGLHPALAVAGAGAICGVAGLVLGLPSLRLPGFYFAMATMAVSLIVGEFVLAQGDLTGGGVGLPVPSFPAPFDSPAGFYWLVAGAAAVVSYLTWNVARRMYGRGLVAIRDSVVTAQACRCSARSW